MEKLKKSIRLTILLVCFVLALNLFGFLYITIKSAQDVAREEIERISEKQQVLSQQILKNVLLTVSNRNSNHITTHTQLRKQIKLFKLQQQFISRHIADAGRGSNEEVKQLIHIIHEVTPSYKNILKIANQKLSSNKNSELVSEPLENQINRSEFDFLDKMNQITKIARANHERVDDQIYKLNMFLFATLVISLAILGLIVIAPLFRQSIRDYEALLTAKAKAETINRSLVENEEKYRRLFSSSPLPMWLFDLQTFKILDVNEIACSHYGYTREEFLCMSLLDIRPEEDKQNFLETDHPLSLSQEDYDRGTWKHRKKDGSLIEVEIFGHDAIFEGRNARMVVMNDVTESKRIEKKLKHSELRLRQAQSIAHVGSWELDFFLGNAFWSEEHCRIYGLNQSDNCQSLESWLSFVHPEDVDFVKASMDGTGQPFNNSALNYRIVRRDGTIRQIYMYSQYELDENGKPIGVYGVSHDVTQSHEAESLLIQSEMNLRMILDLLPQRIFVKDMLGKFLFVNNSFAELYGMNPKELIRASRAGELFSLEGNETSNNDDRQVIIEGKKKIIPEETFVGSQGEQKIFHVTKLPNFWGRRRKQSMLGILNEITEQKRAEFERNSLLADILRRNESLEQFTYIISHNLRSPVANILALSGLLQMINEDVGETAILLEDLSTSTKKLDGVIKDLNTILQTTHHSSEKQEKVSFSELCDDIRLTMTNQLADKQIEIITDFSAFEEMYGVKSYLYSIFYNLITNSIKYRQPKLPLLIEIYSSVSDGMVEITFQDNGLGMDLTRVGDQVFGLYKRFHTHVEGKGMGLYMVKRHVEIMGGKIMLTSQIDKGSTFKIVFQNLSTQQRHS